MYILKDWFFTGNKDCIAAMGFVYDNPNFIQGYYIHTSKVSKAEVNEQHQRIDVYTRSGSHYALSYNSMCINKVSEIKKFSAILNIPASVIRKCYELTNDADSKKLKQFRGNLKDGELYIEMSQTNTVSAYFCSKGAVSKIEFDIHVGTFQDSVLICKYGLVDVRYFPHFDAIEFYHISDGCTTITIKNVSQIDLKVRGIGREYIVKANSKTSFKTKQIRREGLISPDCVNGKSLLWNDDK